MSSQGAWLLACVMALAPAGCYERIDTIRIVPERQSLGAEIYEVVCQRLASEEFPADVSGETTVALCEGREGPRTDTPPRLAALALDRDRLVDALDRVLPEAIHDDLQDFMVRLLPFYDPPEERLPRQTRAAAELVLRIMDDDDAIAALERMAHRQGYRPLRIALGVARPALAYPDLDPFVTDALANIDDGGSAGEQFSTLLRVGALELATAGEDVDPPDPTGDTTLELVRRLLFTGDDDFGSGTPRWTVVRDSRGYVMPNATPGTVPPPFADTNGDRLADLDALGRFVDASGTPLDLASPFPVPFEVGVPRDDDGRALFSDGSRIYAYLDVDRTMLAGVAREGPGLMRRDAPTLLDLTHGLPLLLGPRTMRSVSYGAATITVPGPRTEEGALFDLLHAGGQVLHRDETVDALIATEMLLRDHLDVVAPLIDAMWYGDARADAYPAAALEQPSNFWDDMLRVGTWIAQEPGLTEALLRSLADPRSKRLGQIYGEMMRYRDEVDYDPSDLNRLRRDVTFRDPVDRDLPDSRANRSLFTRSLHLIHDLNGVQMCNKEGAVMRVYVGGTAVLRWPPTGSYARCELLDIPNMAEFYTQAILGRARLELRDATLDTFLRSAEDFGIINIDDLLISQSGIDGLDQSPTPEALNRMVFAPRNAFLSDIMDPAPTRDGLPVEEVHRATIFAWEREYAFTDGVDPTRITFYQAMSPMLQAFEDFDRRTGGRYLFGEMITAQHLHWASRYDAPDASTQRRDPSAPLFSHQDNAVSYEELIADIFTDGDLLIRLHELARALDEIEVRPGVDGIDALAAANEVLLDPERNVGLRYRDGRTMAQTNDGSRMVPVVPMYLILDGLRRVDEAFAADGSAERLDRWRQGRGNLMEQLFGTTTGSTRFDNPRTQATLLALLPFLRERIEAHRAAGDLTTWSTTMHERAEQTLGGPLAYAAIDLMDALQRDPESRAQLAAFSAYLMDETSENDAFDATVVALADLLMVLEDDTNIDPLLHALSAGLAPNARAAVATGEELRLEGSATDATLDLMREIGEVDDRNVLSKILTNLVERSDGGTGETALETIVDVIAEVNRADPGVGTSLEARDYREIFGRTHDFLTNESRGMERLYRVIQEREVR